ncbi:MAG: hypothetical protein SOW25_03670 [Helicobacter sp.]|nr:hypothetical protein [Helicobacter sp.]
MEQRNNVDYSFGLELYLKNNKIVSVENKTTEIIPWIAYAGAVFLNAFGVKKLREFKDSINLPYIKVLVESLGLKILASDGLDFIDTRSKNLQTRELKGGSFAGLSKNYIIKKEADKKSGGVEKLINEIKWLLSLDSSLKPYFPHICDYKISKDSSYFSMPYYTLENLRSKILKGKFGLSEVEHYLKQILDFCFNNLYSQKLANFSGDYVEVRHFGRYYERVEIIKNIEPFSKLLVAKEIIINNKSYENLPHLVEKLREFYKKTHLFKPQFMVRIHGDLHFQNILIDEKNNSFLLADPRGELNGGDMYYDFGKLFHSFNGLYDLIHTDIAKAKILSIDENRAEFSLILGSEALLETYSNIKKLCLELLDSYLLESSWNLKARFAEVMHFSSLMSFHLKGDGVENRALCLYLQAIRLASELLKELEI